MNLSPLPIQQFFNNNGRPLVRGRLFTYVAGTNTKVATYTNAGGTLNTNPIVLNFRGECSLWLDPQQSYKFILAPPGTDDPPTNPIWTVDDITVAPQAFDNAAVDIGSVNNISLNIPQISSPVAFTRVVFKAANTNTGPTTLQINGGTAHPLVWQSSVNLTGGEIRQNGLYEAIFDGGSWQLQGPTLDATDIRIFGVYPSSGQDETARIQAAINTGRTLIFPSGEYLANNLTSTTDNQVFIGDGNVLIVKNANGPLWTCSGRDSVFQNMQWRGESSTPAFTGDNLVVSADNCSLMCCGSRFAFGRAVKSTTGNGLRIIGTNDIYQTADATATGYDIEITGGGNYSRVISALSSQSTGGVLIDNAGGISIVGCQFAKLTVRNNGGVFASSNRFHGPVAIQSSNNSFVNNAVAGNITLGSGATPFSNIMWDDSNIVQSGVTFTVESGVIDSTIHLESMQDSGVTITINASTDNFITSGLVTYTPSWTASTTNPVLNDGSFQYAAYTRKGRRVAVDVSLVMGATTTFGTGTWRISLPFTISSSVGSIGQAWAIDATNVPYVMSCEAAVGLGYVTFYTDQVGGQVGPANPFAWAVNDRLRFSIEYNV